MKKSKVNRWEKGDKEEGGVSRNGAEESMGKI